jgi:hypothetical protein
MRPAANACLCIQEPLPTNYPLGGTGKLSSAEVKKPSPTTRSEQPGLTCSLAEAVVKKSILPPDSFGSQVARCRVYRAAQVIVPACYVQHGSLLPVAIQSNCPLVHHLIAVKIATS